MNKISSRQGGRFPRRHRQAFDFFSNPWAYFIFFVLLNAGLSWGPFSFTWRAWLFVLEFALLFMFAVHYCGSAADKPLWTEEGLPPLPFWFWILFFLGAFGLRFYKLTSIPVWPMIDEGTMSFYAMSLDQKWDGALFYSFNLFPASYLWLFAIFYKIFSPSLFSLWLFPLLISIATLLVGYAACRQFFSKSFSFFWALGWAFAFWPLYYSRFNVPANLQPLWECFALLVLGYLLKASNPSSRIRRSLFLGFTLGFGFCLFFLSWVPMFGLIALALFFILKSIPQVNQRMKMGLAVLMPTLLISLPFWVAYFRLPSNLYVNSLWAFQKGFSWSSYLQTAISNLTVVFWGTPSSIDYFAYKPLDGGFFNPLFGAFFFIGLVEIFRNAKHPWMRWWGTSFFVFFLPTLLTNNLELFRIIGTLPLFLFGTALGIQVLLRFCRPQMKILFLVILMAVSLTVDFYRLAVVYPEFWKTHVDDWEQYGKCPELYRAYEILKPISEQKGPGLLLTEFDSPLEKDPRNKSLVVACYPFDAGRNPQIGPEKAQWAAVFLESYALPLLSERFQGIHPIDLGKDLDRLRPDQDYWMVLLPVNGQTRDILMRWNQANGLLEKALLRSLAPPSLQFRGEVSQLLLGNYALFQGEPLLESRYWFDLADNSRRDGDDPLALQYYKRALQFGHAPAQWYTDCVNGYIRLGGQYIKNRDYINAKKTFQEAARMDPSRAQSPSVMKWLDLMISLQKAGKLPQWDKIRPDAFSKGGLP